MSKQSIRPSLHLIFRFKKLIFKKLFESRNRELITASSIALCILILRFFGLLQPLEWAVLDQFFRLRPDEPLKERIVIVEIDEPSLRELRSWPISDAVLAQLLQKLKLYQPRAIGLDIYRNLPVEPGYQKLVDTYKSLPNLIGIELLAHKSSIRVEPPPVLSQQNQVGFNNVLHDADGKIRRSLLYWHVENQAHESFALKLAKLYLKAEGINPQQAANNRKYLQLGKAVFYRFQPNDGAYVRADNRGYQILSNFPKPGCRKSSQTNCGFRKVPLRDMLADKVPISWFQDRIVLIGSTATSLQDFFLIPYSSRLIDQVQPVAGVELQAYFISELISAALQERPLLKVWYEPWEWLWIFVWSYLGTMTVWQTQRTSKSIFSIIFSCLLLISCAYLVFLDGWWIPVVPAFLTFWASAIAIIYQIANMQEELKRSKEFLFQLINTIPDPIFVKNEKYQWIVLNEAYCQLIGYPKNLLLEKSEYDFFDKHQADAFYFRDRLVFRTQKALEHEEKFTDATGKTYLIATKRSLHKDSAGNVFLIGVIRDITERKLREENLQRTADELSRYNDELKIQEDRLRYLAYHDPLTGLPNRKFFTEKLQESLEWAKTNNSLVGLLFIDLDGFKQVNDTLGHEMGDRLLVTVAHRLSNCLRVSDTVSRLGGDEFTIILRAIPHVDVAAKIAQKILASITEPIVLEDNTTRVSASIGISIYPVHSQDMEILIQQADSAMYRAKHFGKNRLEFAG
ncbi:MAG: CHASE2 domain-containing protein [Nostocaceae cyanobacterium]|nr:CHASE2 domain-containing protein [Nostocaceae cyanobacterium]